MVELKFRKAGIVFHQSLWRYTSPAASSSSSSPSSSSPSPSFSGESDAARTARLASLGAASSACVEGGSYELLAEGAVTVYSIDKASKSPCPVTPEIEADLRPFLIGTPS